MHNTEKKVLVTLILHRKRRKKREFIRETYSKPRIRVRDIFTKREQHGEFHRLAQELKLRRKEI